MLQCSVKEHDPDGLGRFSTMARTPWAGALVRKVRTWVAAFLEGGEERLRLSWTVLRVKM